MVGDFDDVQVVFDNDNRIAGVGKFLQDMDELGDVHRVQSSGRLIQNIQGLPGGSFR